MNVDVDPDWGSSTAASDRGAGPLGFAGTVSKGSEQAAGLATLSDDGLRKRAEYADAAQHVVAGGGGERRLNV